MNRQTASLQKYKRSHPTNSIAPATTINSVTAPLIENQDNVAPAQIHVHCALMVAIHGTSMVQDGTAMRRGGQVIVTDVRRQKWGTIYFGRQSIFVSIGGKGTVADMGFVACVQMFDHCLMMVSIRCMLMGLGGFMVRRGGSSTVRLARTYMK
ncbi:hypothetical protein FPOAC1_003825 [Fusarium poae]|jgi:hypothetical protein|uniref:hypothetical protein n=1 Tax=Fusarium poae TaxID=36050 RepID=UPI001CEBACEC|nr:hypothetical protein FPOAC1_003825 [Fusarium poae]KAG8677797.1 hypothetical protein FPOAC1_003825 [Fusarium poae]